MYHVTPQHAANARVRPRVAPLLTPFEDNKTAELGLPIAAEFTPQPSIDLMARTHYLSVDTIHGWDTCWPERGVTVFEKKLGPTTHNINQSLGRSIVIKLRDEEGAKLDPREKTGEEMGRDDERLWVGMAARN